MPDDPDEPYARLQSGVTQLGVYGRHIALEYETSSRLRRGRSSAAVGHSKRQDAVLNTTWSVRGRSLETVVFNCGRMPYA